MINKFINEIVEPRIIDTGNTVKSKKKYFSKLSFSIKKELAL
tara:strand:- start:472 stop:597 length:126 start_codon:yes stop_codon:yes gene_type:complete